MNYNSEPLSVEERERILSELHKREFLEQQAVAEDKRLKQQQAELQYRQSLADAARKVEEERRQRLSDSLHTTMKIFQQALEAFQEGDERRCYVLLVKADPFFIAAKHQVNQAPERPSSGGSLPTLRVKADNALGFAIINSEDLTPAHEILEDNA